MPVCLGREWGAAAYFRGPSRGLRFGQEPRVFLGLGPRARPLLFYKTFGGCPLLSSPLAADCDPTAAASGIPLCEAPLYILELSLFPACPPYGFG